MKKRNFLIAMAGISLALGMMVLGCDQDASSGGSGDSVVYRSETAQGLMVLTITKPKAAGNSNILASAYGSPVYAYMPQNGDEYTITLAGVPVSSGKVTVDKTNAKMTFTVTETEVTFEATITSDGGSLTFTAGIRYDNGGGINVSISVETTTPPFKDDPIKITPTTPTTPSTPGTPYFPPYQPQPGDTVGDDFTKGSAVQVYQVSNEGVVGGAYNGSGTVKIGDLEIGTVSNGKLTYTLPASVSNSYLMDIDFLPTSVSVSPSTAKILASEGTLELYTGSTLIGGLIPIKTVESTMYAVMYWYFNQDCSITGTDREEEGWYGSGPAYISNSVYSIDAKAGWNKIYVNATQSDTQSAYTYTTSSSNFPSDLKWVFQSFSGEDTHGIDVSTWPQDDASSGHHGGANYFIKSEDGKALAVNFMARGDGRGTRIPTVYVLQDEGAGTFPIGTWTCYMGGGDVEKIIFTVSTITFDSPYADTWQYDYTVSGSNTFNFTNYRLVPYTPTPEQQAAIAAFNEAAFRAAHPWIPDSSTIGPLTATKTEIYYNIKDKIDVEFVDDATVAGTIWVTVDNVREIESFNPSDSSNASSSGGLQKLTFETGGNLIWNDFSIKDKWTKGLWLSNRGGNTASKYEVRNVSGTDYLFVENKQSGDYPLMALKPRYYVLVKQ